MFAIRNKKDKRWVYGTDKRSEPHKQRLSNEQAMLFQDKEDAEWQMKVRRMDPYRYEVVEVLLVEKSNGGNL